MDVVLIRWPDESDRREKLVAAEMARLLLLDDTAEPPAPVDCLEDWIRVPAADQDVQARVAGLVARLHSHQAAVPVVDADGVIRFGPGWASLPPVEARLARALADRFGAVVGRETLGRSGWPDGAPGRNALDVHMLRLRRRLAPVGLVIRTVRSRGYVLNAAARTERKPERVAISSGNGNGNGVRVPETAGSSLDA